MARTTPHAGRDADSGGPDNLQQRPTGSAEPFSGTCLEIGLMGTISAPGMLTAAWVGLANRLYGGGEVAGGSGQVYKERKRTQAREMDGRIFHALWR